MERLSPRCESKARTGTEKGGKSKKSLRGGRYWRVNGGGEAEQSGNSCDRAKEGIKHVRVDERSQLPRTTSGRWRWMGRTEFNGR